MTMPSLEAQFWWATSGTMCCVVVAVAEEDARILVAHRFSKAGRQFRGRVSRCTREQYRRYQEAIEADVKRAQHPIKPLVS